MIEVRDLSKNYGNRAAIRSLNFSVKKGEVVGFLGPNGAGKSTTMKILTGYMAPSSGEVRINGLDIFEDPIAVKRHIGYLPETPPVYHDMFVREYLTFVAKLKGVPRERLSSMVKSAIDKTNLHDVSQRLIGNLSKGFRQRVGLAQALVSDPDLLILDEPTVGLDPKQMAEIRHLIQQLKGQHTIVLSTHILSEVQASCDKVIIVNQGRIVAEDSLVDLSRRMAGGGHVVTLRVKRAAESLLPGLRSIPGVQSVQQQGTELLVVECAGDRGAVEETVESLSSYVVGRSAGLLELKVDAAGLEDIFIKLTSETTSGSKEKN